MKLRNFKGTENKPITAEENEHGEQIMCLRSWNGEGNGVHQDTSGSVSPRNHSLTNSWTLMRRVTWGAVVAWQRRTRLEGKMYELPVGASARLGHESKKFKHTALICCMCRVRVGQDTDACVARVQAKTQRKKEGRKNTVSVLRLFIGKALKEY